jgi:hypothetical protein
MSASGSGSNGSRAARPIAEAGSVEEASALLAWRGAVQGAQAVLLEASRIYEGGSDGRLGAVLVGLRDLESEIDGQLAAPGRAAPTH